MEKKVLHILWSGCIGGAARAVYQLVQSQMKNSKFVPAVAFAQGRGYYYEETKKLGCEVIDLGLRSDRNIFNVWRVKGILHQFQIHHFQSAEITLMLASILCKGAVRVYTHRGGSFNYPWRKKLRYRIAGCYLRHRSHSLCGNTHHACSSAAQLFGIEAERWQVTYNGIDSSLLKPLRSKEEVAREVNLPLDGATVIGTSGHLRAWKRLELLLRACSLLPHESSWLLVVGDGPVKNELQALSHELRIADRMIFTGMKEHIGDYLASMDVFVLASIGLESFGNSVVEAMSFGIPPIVFHDGGGLLEHVQDGQNGYVVFSVDELAARLRGLTLSPKSRR